MTDHPPRRRIVRLLRRAEAAASLLIGLCGGGLTAFLLVRPLTGDRWLPVAVGNTILHLLLPGAAALLPLTVVRRRWRCALSLTLPTAAFLTSYGLMFLPRTLHAAEDGPQLSLLTYNIHNEHDALAPMIALIREADADVVAIQELDHGGAAVLSAALADVYPHQALHPADIFVGQGVFSRYPLLADEYWQITLGHQRVVIDLDGTPVALYNAHPVHPFLFHAEGIPGFDPSRRRQEIDVVLGRAAAEAGPVVIAGDFNMTDQTDDYRLITARYGDAYRAAGWGMGFTFPALDTRQARPLPLRDLPLPIRPLARLDYVFHSEQFQAVEARVWPTSGGSDHRPLLVRLALTAP